MNATNERVELIEKILDGKINKKKVKEEVGRLEKEYGEEAFSFLEYEKREKPWTSEYYNELNNLSIVGVGSKDFILHLVEVRDNLRMKRNIPVILIAIIIIMIIVALFCSKGLKTDKGGILSGNIVENQEWNCKRS